MIKLDPIRLLRRKRFYFSILFITFLYYTYDFLELRLSDTIFIQRLADNPYGYSPEVSYYDFEDRRIRYLEIGNDSLPLIFFIHGAPSSSAFWESLLKDSTLLQYAKLGAVDRPGYGYSGYGRPLISVEQQAKFLAHVLQDQRQQHPNIVIHGSSYGGTVAARLGMDFPKLMDGILLQSASVAPGKETTYWISYPTSHWLLKWMIPGSMTVANAEKLSHKTQLDFMAPNWHKITSNVIIMHGASDQLIFPENACYAEEKLINANYLETNIYENSRHDLLWTKTSLLKSNLLKLLSMTKPLAAIIPKQSTFSSNQKIVVSD